MDDQQQPQQQQSQQQQSQQQQQPQEEDVQVEGAQSADQTSQPSNVKESSAVQKDFQANDACLKELISLGIDKNAAKKALYYTTNNSVEKALDWVFSNPNPLDLSRTTLEQDLSIKEQEQLIPQFNDFNLEEQLNNNYKMVFVINQSLQMSIGKSCSQTAHAALAINDLIRDKIPYCYTKWLSDGETKIVLKGQSTQQLEELKEKADNLGLVNCIIQDAGRTEIEPGSKTVFVIFGSNNQVDKVTGNLRLLK